jgi:Cu/Ag efflux pump CusA
MFRLAGAKYDVFPEFAPPQVSVQTEAPGLAPEQVEILVTQPVENAINGVMGVETIRSNSIQGLSVISIVFKANTDIYLARQVLAERLATVATQLPQGVAAPTMSALVSSTGDLLAIGLTPAQAKNGNKPISLMELRSVVDWMIKPRLKAVPGVAQVSAFGGDVRQLQIQIDPDKLVQYGLSFEEVLNVARLATGIRGAGYIDTPNQRIVLQTEAQSLTPDDLAKTVLVQGSGANINVSVTLGDVAHVVETPAPPISAGSVMGVPGEKY